MNGLVRALWVVVLVLAIGALGQYLGLWHIG